MDLAQVHEELVFELREGVTLVSGGAPAVALGDTFDELSDRFEALALCHLLENGDVDKYRLNLVRAAQARRYFLRRARDEKTLDDRHHALSRTRALLASLVAGNLVVARAIVDLSVEDFHADWEYEDDHCYYLAIHRRMARPDAAIESILDRFEAALEGSASPRLDALRALSVRDRAAYLAAISGLLEQEKERIDEDRDSADVQEGDLLYWPRSFISVEALALLQLGDLAGLGVARAADTAALPRCPMIARVPVDTLVFADLLEELEQAT
jgi:hypothetical protein